MNVRLRAEIWVKAYIRRCMVENVAAVVARRGDDTAGSILIKINKLDGNCMIYSPTIGEDGNRAWLRATGEDFVSEETADAYIERQRGFDPDIWVIEVEDREGRHRLDDPIRG